MKIITEQEMKAALQSQIDLENSCVDLETARKIIMDAVLPLDLHIEDTQTKR